MIVPKDTKYFNFCNVNPNSAQRSGDCVVRAIAKALNKSWDEIYDDLCNLGREIKRMPNEDLTYQKYLSRLGYKKEKALRRSDNTRYTVEQFCRKFRTGTYIINTSGHLTVIKDGVCYDTWNCSSRSTGNFWKIC